MFLVQQKKSLLCRSDPKCEMVHTTFISFVLGKEVRTKLGIEIVMTNELLCKVSKNHKWKFQNFNISSVVEFQRWWVLKSKIFGQESTYC